MSLNKLLSHVYHSFSERHFLSIKNDEKIMKTSPPPPPQEHRDPKRRRLKNICFQSPFLFRPPVRGCGIPRRHSVNIKRESEREKKSLSKKTLFFPPSKMRGQMCSGLQFFGVIAPFVYTDAHRTPPPVTYLAASLCFTREL